MKGQIVLSVIVVVLIIFCAAAGILIFNYNGIVAAEKTTESAKADIETVCQRRLDLIPNLVATVKGYAQHERQTLVAVTEAREKAQGVLQSVRGKDSLNEQDLAALAGSQSQLMSSLKSLFALVENYPDLKANSNFLALQDQLEGTENRISVARQRYNYAVRQYNTRIDTFPGNIFAVMFGFDEKEYFEAKETAMDSVEVSF